MSCLRDINKPYLSNYFTCLSHFHKKHLKWSLVLNHKGPLLMDSIGIPKPYIYHSTLLILIFFHLF